MHDPSSCLRWLMQQMQNETRIGSASLRMVCEMRQLNTRIQVGIETQCS